LFLLELVDKEQLGKLKQISPIFAALIVNSPKTIEYLQLKGYDLNGYLPYYSEYPIFKWKVAELFKFLLYYKLHESPQHLFNYFFNGGKFAPFFNYFLWSWYFHRKDDFDILNCLITHGFLEYVVGFHFSLIHNWICWKSFTSSDYFVPNKLKKVDLISNYLCLFKPEKKVTGDYTL